MNRIANPIRVARETDRPYLSVAVRWFIRRDMPQVLEIEDRSFPTPWTENDFLCCLRQRNCIALVAEHGDQIVGYILYELLKDSLHILNIAVDVGYRRRGVGTQIMAKMFSKLEQQRRHRISIEVVDHNLFAHLFLKSQGFHATEVLRDFYDECGVVSDGYRFEYSVESDEQEQARRLRRENREC